MPQKFLITGVAGFIGFHLCKKLLENGEEIIGIDNLNSYYDVQLKKDRLEELNFLSNREKCNWNFFAVDLINADYLSDIFKNHRPTIVINLAAQAGVRYSLENPVEYINSNIIGFFNILECCKKYPVKRLLYASSSSVYGGNTKIPFSEEQEVKHPVSLYAASKLSNELMANTYSHLYKIPTIGLRFFTVYGPWGRPDMSPMIFTNSIINNQPLRIFNYGDMSRDFTYIDDVIEVIIRLINKFKNKFYSITNNEISLMGNSTPAIVLNVGNSKPVKLMSFIETLENELGLEAIKDFQDMQPGDVKDTYADTRAIQELLGFKPNTEIKEGIKKFITWYKKYHGV